MAGKHGRELHEDIVCCVRQHVPVILGRLGWKVGEDYWIVGHEGAMLAGSSRRFRGGQLPDLLFVVPQGKVILEVGNCLIGKWGMLPVVHVSFSEEVSTVNTDPTDDFALDLAAAVELALGERKIQP